MTKRVPSPSRSVAPCGCTGSRVSAHGFVDEEGVPWGMYLAEQRQRGPVRWVDLALSLQTGGTIAVRIFVRGRRIHARIVPPGADPNHPALVLGCWMTPRAVAAEVQDLATLIRSILRRDVRLPEWLRSTPDEEHTLLSA